MRPMSGRTRGHAPGALLVIALVVGGCVGSPPAASSSLTAQATPEATPELDAATADALRFRTEFSFRADLDFIRAVAADPRAVMDFGVPLLPEEIKEIERRGIAADRIIPEVQDYAALFPAEFGGLYIDQANHGFVTVLWTDHLGEHDAALRERLAGAGVVVLRQVRYAESVLRALQDRISNDSAWFVTIPAAMQVVGVDTIGNAVEVSISSANPAAPDLVRAYYGVEPAMIKVESDGTGAVLLPTGTVRGRVVKKDGTRPGVDGYMVDSISDDPGWCGGGDVGYGVLEDGTFEIPCKVGSRTIQIRATPPSGEGWVVIGEATVDVPASGIVEVVIEVEPVVP